MNEITKSPSPLVAGVARESFPGETRVALVPSTVATLRKSGWDVVVEAGAGVAAGFPDEQFSAQGARVVQTRDEIFAAAGVVLGVRAAGANPQCGADDFGRLQRGQILIAGCDPLSEPQAVADLATTGVTAFALEMLPRITRAQSMDILSSMATIAGYKAVLIAAGALPRMFPLLMTAAGTVKPARVLVVGAGVAGLQAIATAKRLGAIVYGYDIRPAVKEQVESLGGKFVELELDVGKSEQAGGYAREMDEEFYRRQRELMARVVADCDVVITTAAIPGKKAPVLVTCDMIDGMAPGSVVVDLAAERGGNCDLTRPGEIVVHNGITVLGPLNVPAGIPYHASEMWARNITTFLLNLVRDGVIHPDPDDEIVRDTLIVHGGDVVHPRVRDLLKLPPLNREPLNPTPLDSDQSMVDAPAGAPAEEGTSS